MFSGMLSMCYKEEKKNSEIANMLPKQMSFKIVILFSLVIRAMYGRVRQELQDLILSI